MPNIGPSELLVVLVVVLLVLGPSRLPDAARQVGRALGEFRRVTSGFQAEVRDAMAVNDPPRPRPAPTAGTAAHDDHDLPTSPEQAEVRVDDAQPGAARPAPDV